MTTPGHGIPKTDYKNSYAVLDKNYKMSGFICPVCSIRFGQPTKDLSMEIKMCASCKTKNPKRDPLGAF